MFANILVKLRKKYRIAFIDHDSLILSRISLVRPLTLIFFFFSFTLIVFLGTASLVVFTPFIREMIPGYTNPRLESKYQEQQKTVEMLLQKVEQQDSFLVSFQRIYGAERKNVPPGAMEEIIADARQEVYDYNGAEEEEDQAMPANEGEMANRTQAGREFRGYTPIHGMMNLVLPVKGIVTNPFKPGEKHFGLDIVANENALIKSVADGFVIFSEYSNQTGYVIGVSHGNNLVSFYKHNSRVFKKVGSYVFAGEAIAVIGNSGENSTGPHLHFELWHDGKPINPSQYIIIN